MSKRKAIIPVFIPHVACPYQCVFCDQHTISGERHCPSPAEVEQLVETYLATMGDDRAVEVAFFGGSFTGLPLSHQEKLLAAVQRFIRQNRVEYIRVSTRPDYIDETCLDLLKYYDVRVVELGVQSLDDRVLASSGRGHNSQQTVAACSLLRKRGFKLGIQLMPGLPASSEASDLFTVQKTVALKPDFCRVYPTLVLKNTKLHEMYCSGNYRPLSMEVGINRVKVMVGVLYKNKIPVIRIGLHPSQQLEEALVAGPYHPSLGYLVKSRMYYDLARALLRRAGSNRKSIEIAVHPSQVAFLTGFHKLTLSRLKNEFNNEVTVKPRETLAKDTLALYQDNELLAELTIGQLINEQY